MDKTTFRVGFTGSRKGMTDEQRKALTDVLQGLKPEADVIEFHHGACIGADEQAAMIAGNLGFVTVAHPGDNRQYRTLFKSSRTLPIMDNLLRNKVIAEIAQIMLATPMTEYPVLRSGTWATIRYSNTIGRFTTIILPDGSYMHNG